jgi:aspartate/methionine/tyrosine aminotransferase
MRNTGIILYTAARERTPHVSDSGPRFSGRVPWPQRANRLTEILHLRRRRQEPILDLSESNPTRVGLSYPGTEIAMALAHPGVARYEPDPRGLAGARDAIAAWLGGRGRPVGSDRIFLTASSSESYSFLLKLLCEPGDAILVPAPSYPLFDHLAALEGVRVLSYPLDPERRFRLDLEGVESRVARATAERIRALVVVNPNNPTGSALLQEERAGLDRLAAAAGVAIVSDEVFFDYLHPTLKGGPASLVPTSCGTGEAAALTFTLGGLSKACGLPQMKLGFCVVSGPEAVRAEAMARLEFVADAYLSVGAPVQLAAARLLELGDGIRGAIRARLDANRRALAAAVAPDTACKVLPSDGGWSAVLQVPSVVPEEDLVAALLSEEGILVHPGYFFDFPRESFLILSLLPEPDVFVNGLERILARIESL